MLCIKKVKKEKRARDKKRERYLLTMGKKRWHITPYELADIAFQILPVLRAIVKHKRGVK